MVTRRRMLVAAAGMAVPLAGCWSRFPEPERGPFGVVFAGKIDDGGFNSLVLEALTQAELARAIPMRVTSPVGSSFGVLGDALRAMADSDAKMIFGIGPALAEPIQRVAWEFPEQRFTLIQGELVRPNLGAYALREEEPAFLAGFLAARLSRTRRVGMLSDLREDQRKRIGEAFHAGARRAFPDVSVLLEEPDGSPASVRQLSESRADVIYGALDAAPLEALAACRAGGLKFIGRLRDWSDAAPDTVVGTCLVNPGVLFASAVQDVIDSVWRGDYLRLYGLRYPEMVAFTMNDRVPRAVVAEVRDAALDVISGRVALAPRG